MVSIDIHVAQFAPLTGTLSGESNDGVQHMSFRADGLDKPYGSDWLTLWGPQRADLRAFAQAILKACDEWEAKVPAQPDQAQAEASQGVDCGSSI